MPAKAGIQCRRAIADWTPAFAGVTSSNIIVPHQYEQNPTVVGFLVNVFLLAKFLPGGRRFEGEQAGRSISPSFAWSFPGEECRK